MATHVHLQLNAEQTNPAAKINADVVKAFDQQPDSIVFNECNSITRAAIRREARKRGYGVFFPKGAASQLALVWRLSRYRHVAHAVRFAMKGYDRRSPNRYVIWVRLRDVRTGETVTVVGTHTVSEAFTHRDATTAWRKRGWNRHAGVMGRVIARQSARCDVLIWSGDMNRPNTTFPGGVLFPMFAVKGAKTSRVLHSGHTHGSVTFDYIGVVSREHAVRSDSVTTPSFYSDHDGVLAPLSW